MDIYEIRTVSDAWFQVFYNCWENSFPESERRTLVSLKYEIEQDERFHCEIATEDYDGQRRFLGLICRWRFKTFCYVEYLAVEASLRGRQIGHRMMKNLQERVAMPIVLEVELPTDELTCRRIGFYQRLGFRLLDKGYVQPSYGVVPGVPLRLMLWNNLPAGCTEERMVQTLLCEVYGADDADSK